MFHFTGQSRRHVFNGVIFTQQILNKMLRLCMDNDLAVEIEKKKMKGKRNK